MGQEPRPAASFSVWQVIDEYLEPREIYSRGRFGSWKYEIGNPDYSLMQGKELVDRWLGGTQERVFRT